MPCRWPRGLTSDVFDQDVPGAGEKAKEVRVYGAVDDPAQVFIFLTFDSLDDANEAGTIGSSPRASWSVSRTCRRPRVVHEA